MALLRHSIAALTAIGLAPLLALWILVRPALRHGLRERLGYRPAGHDGRLQIHASSVGEAKAALRLIEELDARGHPVRTTTSTATGLEIFEHAFPSMPSSLAPFDHPWFVDRALRATRPKMSVLIETEIWPVRIAAAARRRIPIVVVSGRLSDRSFPRYSKIRRWMGPTLRRIDAVGARSDVDAERFIELGVPADRVRVTGDLKLDPPSDQPTLAIDLIRALADADVVVAGSTHPGEEEALLDAQEAAEKEGHTFILVIAPRHVERGIDVGGLCRERQRRVYLRSELEGRHLVPGEVLVLDSLGELSALYATASIAFVGGTLVPVGGHNLVEPVHAGCPVLYGPHCENVRKIADILEASTAGRRIEDSAELSRALIESFDDLEACRIRGELGRETLEAHRGAVARTLEMIEEVLDRRAGEASGVSSGPNAESAATAAPTGIEGVEPEASS